MSACKCIILLCMGLSPDQYIVSYFGIRCMQDYPAFQLDVQTEKNTMDYLARSPY